MSLRERSSSLRNCQTTGSESEFGDFSISKEKKNRSTSESSVGTLLGRIRDVIGWQSKRSTESVCTEVDFIPIRATSTPMRLNATDTLSYDFSGLNLDLSDITPDTPNCLVYPDFAELGAFGTQKFFLNSDFDNDITAYSFHKQIKMPPIESTWTLLGGERVYTRSALFVFDLFYEARLPREVTHLAIYYMCSMVAAGNISRDDLEDLIVAAIHLASKVESQFGLRRRLLQDFNMKRICEFERKIMETVNFNLWPTALPAFMRLLNSQICKQSWHWEFAKCASELALCDQELAQFKPSLLAGVVMRFLSILEGGNSWNEDCYAIIQEPVENYDRPHALLCRLFLAVNAQPTAFSPIFSKYAAILKQVLPKRYAYLREEASAAVP